MKPRSKLFVAGLLLALLALSMTAISAQTQARPASDTDAYPPPNPNTVYVDQSFLATEHGTVDAPFRTIAAGINAVANDGLVLVAPGTYVENLVIGKSLTLRGSGLDVTTIDGGGKGNTISVDRKAGLTVSVEHFRITGAGSDSANSDAGLKSYPGSTLYARWNWFTGNGLMGVISYGPDIIARNLFSNNGNNQGGGYAIWASEDSSAKIYNNTVRQTSLGDTGTNRVGTGIAIYNSAVQADIRNNIISDAFRGIWVLFPTVTPQSMADYNILWNNNTNYDGLAPGAYDQLVDPKLTTTSYLDTGSPAINMGDPAASFKDRDGTTNDVGMRQLYITSPVNPVRYGNFATVADRQPLGLAAFGGSAVWMSSYYYDTGIYRLDAANGDPRQTLLPAGVGPSRYGGLTYDNAGGILYHANIYGEGIQKIDPGTGNVMMTLPFAVKSGGDLAFDGTNLWQAAGGWPDPKLYKIDAATGATLDSFVSPVPGQTQTFGLAYANSALWLSKDTRIYKINPTTQSIICSFAGPMADMRGLAFLPGYDMMASSFDLDRVMRFDLPESCNENTQPANPITVNWSPKGPHTFKTQPIYSNEAICSPRADWQDATLNVGDLLPKTTGGTIRGTRLLLPDSNIPLDGTGLSGPALTKCGNGLWAVWSPRPASWANGLGVLLFDWNPPRTPGITLVWEGQKGETQTLRFQHRVANEPICEARPKDWSNLVMQSGDYLPVVSNPDSQTANFSGVRLNLAPGDSLKALELDGNTQLTDCGGGLWVLWSNSPANFAKAYGSISATWAALPTGQISLKFLGVGAGEEHPVQWQPILAGQSACVAQEKWNQINAQPNGKLPLGDGVGIRLRLPDADSLLTSLRLQNVYVRDCGRGDYAILANSRPQWSSVIGAIVIDWSVFYLDLDCVWFQNTETVDHSRERSSHLWCRNDGTVTAYYEAGGSVTRTVSSGYTSIPAGVNRVRPGSLFATDLTATLHDPLAIKIHFVPVNLVDVGISAPSGVDYIPLLLETINLPYFSYSYKWESTINVSGSTANQIWNNMETAMNGQPAVVGTDAYVLIASSAPGKELYFGQGPFNTWKGMFFLQHPTTYIHELLHSLLGLKHVGGAPGPDPAWPYGATRTFPEEATFWGNTQAGTWERLRFTGNDCDALMSYGNSNPYGLGSDYRVRCLSPFTGAKGWTKVGSFASSLSAVQILANNPVMWTKGPDLFKFNLAHTSLGDTATGPLMTLNSGETDEQIIVVPAYEADPGYVVDSFVTLPAGVNTADLEGRQYPPNFGTLAESSWEKDDAARSLSVTTECAWLISETNEGLDRLVSGPYVGDKTITLPDQIKIHLQVSCGDGERTDDITMPLPPRIYLPLTIR